MRFYWLLSFYLLSLTSTLAEEDKGDDEAPLDDCPPKTPKRGLPCDRSNGSPSCPYSYLRVPASKENGFCDMSAPLSCLPMMTCDCQDSEWKCLRTEMEFCAGQIPPGAFDDCKPKLKKTFMDKEGEEKAQLKDEL